MNPTFTPIPADQNDISDYDPELPPSSRGPYNYDDLELSIICEGLSVSDPPDTGSDLASNDTKYAEGFWCHKCFTGFRTTGALLEHRRTSTLHITCSNCEMAEDFATLMELRQHCCDRHFGCPHCEGASVWNTAAGLNRHYQMDHFLCRACFSEQYFATRDDLYAHCLAFHITCSLCSDLLAFRYQGELREHCLRQHFGCPFCNAVSWSEGEESLKRHIRLEHWPCCICAYQQVFASREGLLAHRRTAHGFFDVRHFSELYPLFLPFLPFYSLNIVYHSDLCLQSENADSEMCQCPYCPQPWIDWPTSWRVHMEQCHYPNACNTNFDPGLARGVSYCNVCRKTLELHDQYHFFRFHYCQNCAHYEMCFKAWTEDHMRECGRQFVSQWWHQWQKENEACGMRAAGPFQHGNSQPGNFHEERREQQQQPNQKSEPNESARDSFQREHEGFDTRANEQRAPTPTQKPQEPAPLDIYTILKISPESSPDDIKRTVRIRRIETHPDKRRRQSSSREEEDTIEEEAKLVGWAADIVLDPEKRRKHDEQMRAWRVRYG